MAALRKSARASEARKKALEKAAEFEARHQALVNLSQKYFETEARIEDLRDEHEEQIRALYERTENQVAVLKGSLKETVRAMVQTHETKANIAQRLGLSVATLGKLLTTKPQAPRAAAHQSAQAGKDE